MTNLFGKCLFIIFISLFLQTFSYSAEFNFVGVENAPLYFTKENKITGFLKNIIEAVCKKSKFTCNFETTDSIHSVLDSLNSGKTTGFVNVLGKPGDAENKLIEMLGRQDIKQINQVVIFKSPYVIILNKDEKQSKLTDLHNYTFVLEKKWPYSAMLKEKDKLIKNMNTTYQSDPVKLLVDLNNQQTPKKHAALMNRARFDYLIKSHNLILKNLYELGDSIPGMHGIVFSPNANQNQLKIFIAQMKSFLKSKEFRKVLKDSQLEFTKV